MIIRSDGKPKRVIDFRGIPVSIESDVGDIRHGKEMQYPYGYIKGETSADGDSLDVFVGPNIYANDVYIIRQMRPPSFKEYDEDKVMLGFDSPRHARAAYEVHYDDPGFFGSMESMPFWRFLIDRLGHEDPSLPVDTLDGVDSIISRVPSSDREELLKIGGWIWGEDYNFQWANTERIRAEVSGFLLDQKEALSQKPETEELITRN